MSTFKKPRFGGAPRGIMNRSFESKELYDATCNSCHERCQVPFRPNGKKPIYCKNCFRPDEDRARPQRQERFGGERRSFAPAPQARDSRIDDLKRQMDAMQATLEKIAASLEAAQRATALTAEVRKHVPAPKPAAAPKAAAKAPAKKAAKKTAKK